MGCGPSATHAKTETRNSVAYPGAAWGSDGDTIYFLKQVAQPQGNSIWFCKMNWDGSQKQEIAEMWAGQNPYIDTQNGPVWMEVNGATSNAAIGVEFGMATVGIWVIGLDGKNLHKPFEPVWNDKEHERNTHPSWSPDGSQIVYCKDSRTLEVFDFKTKKRTPLTNGPRDEQPSWSPKGDWIAYMHCLRCDGQYADTRIWLIRPDGSEQEPVLDAKNQPIKGWWPSWSPDETRISIAGGLLTLADVATNRIEEIDPLYVIGGRSPWQFLGHHWGKRGWLVAPGGSIVVIDEGGKKARQVAAGGIYGAAEGIQWGTEPVDLKGK
jgi:hypothetical protein